MQVDVALLPGQKFDPARCVCVVVDVLRASSSIVTLLERGAACVVAARDIGEARRLHERLPDHLLCGEKDGLPPPGFDHGNSPSEFARLDLGGRAVILATANGTRIMSALAKEAPVVLVGCLLNRSAIAAAAIGRAQERGLDVAVVCSAAYGGSVFVLEDALGAGAIADAAARNDASPALADAARFARGAFNIAQPRIGGAVRSAYHAQELVDAGFADDVAYCAQLDVSRVAPLVEVAEDGVLRITAR
jgi:2-phosphosulfolactate phosphatase